MKIQFSLVASALLLSVGSAQAAEPAKAQAESSSESLTDSTVVAKWNEGKTAKTLTYKELKEERKAAFRRIEQEQYNSIRRELESLMLDKLLEAEASKNGKTTDEYVKSLSDAIPAEEVKKFYETTVSKDGKGPPFESVEARIRQYLAMKDKVENVKKAAGLELTLPEPEVPLVEFDLAGRPHVGPEDAKVTIVEFSDFQCPYCARAIEPMKEIVKAFPKDVQVYFLHFPLSFHKEAKPAAIAARCAQQQDKFWPMHDAIFENQSKMSTEDLTAHATKVGLDMKKYEKCMADPETTKYVDADMAQGMDAGVGGTPSFFVNGKQTQGPPSVESIRAIVEG